MGKVWANDFTADDFTGTSKYHIFSPVSNMVVDRIRTWFVFINDPIFTDINCKIYSTDPETQAPDVLLATSLDVRTKTELIQLEHGYIETYFTFANIPLYESSRYAIVINGTGYTPTDSSYIAWRLDFPDPIYETPSVNYSFESLNQCPYRVYVRNGEM